MSKNLYTFTFLVSGWLCSVGMAMAQNNADNLDWVEQATPAPPVFSAEGLMPLDMPPYVSVSVGIDPRTLNVGDDGVVRYVVVMRNATGTVNAAYEGIRCFTRDVKTYARWTSQGAWSLISNPAWRALNDNMPSRHAMAFARQGACDGTAANNAAAIQKAMKLPQGGSKGGF
jgi:hypothetical protein